MQDSPEIIKSYQDGDEKAFETLFEKYKRPVFNFIFYMVKNRAEAEDLAQEVFLKAYFKRASFEGRSSFKLWLLAIARNACLDRIKKPKFTWLPWESKGRSQEDHALSETVPSPEPTPEQTLEKKEESGRVAGLLDKLPEQQRMALFLSHFEGMAYQEISEVMGCSLAKVKVLIYRAKTRLKKLGI